jgi:hypothetical protein
LRLSPRRPQPNTNHLIHPHLLKTTTHGQRLVKQMQNDYNSTKEQLKYNYSPTTKQLRAYCNNTTQNNHNTTQTLLPFHYKTTIATFCFLWPFGNTTINSDSAIQSFSEKRIKIEGFESPLNQSRGSNCYPTIFIKWLQITLQLKSR